jgi:glycosyltransferase involved in cell wall biosynthesis
VRTLSIIIPAYNEAGTIGDLLARVTAAALPGGMEKEIIVVDDFSTDGTREFLETVRASATVILHPANRGKGAAIRTGLKAATGDFTVIQDADLEYDPADYPRLLAPLLADEADVVYGSRFLRGRRSSGTRWWHYGINRALTLISNACSGLSLTDMETCYKLFSRKVLQDVGPRLVSNRFEFEPEITARIARAGYRITEVAVSYAYRPFGKGKKIGWRDGIATLWAILRFNILER